MKPSLLIPLLVALSLAAVAAPLPPAPVRPLPTAALPQREIRAQLSPRRHAMLAAEIGARIKRISVREGASFRARQVLVVFDCSLQQAQLAKARAALAASDKTFAANQRLFELNSIGQLELELSETEAAKARAEIAAVSTLLDKCSISAPYGGRVGVQKVQEQQYVQPGQELLEILDDSVLELEFIVPSRWMAWLRAGHVFQVQIDETGRSYPARVQRLGARVDPVSQSIKVVAAIDGRYAELVSGMSGRVALAPPAR